MIRAANLVRVYQDGEAGAHRVLDGACLEVAAGELVALCGRSGSGKSTLLHILAGLDGAFAGEVEVGGVRLDGLDEAGRARLRAGTVGLVFQSFHLLAGLSAIENVALPAFFAPAATPPWPRALELLGRIGLAEKAHRRPAQLSGGERQRVALARALFAAPKVLLCDEPTGNLDGQTAADIVALLEELHRGGLTILVATHEERLRSVAQRVVTVSGGRLS